MFEYIKGELIDLTPASAVVENNGIGYFVHISLNTYTRFSGHNSVQMYLHQVVREDAHLLYGFVDKAERETFRHLISVSGVGANTARVMLSSLSAGEIQSAIVSGNAKILQGVKGIGAKSAQRIIIELKDKMGKDESFSEILLPKTNSNKEEALSALIMLGFSRNSTNKVLDKLCASNLELGVEDLVKLALKQL